MINFIKKYKVAIIAAALIVAALVVAFISGGNLKGCSNDEPVQTGTTSVIETTVTVDNTAESTQVTTESTTSAETTVQTTTAESTDSTQAVTQSQNNNSVSSNTEKAESTPQSSGTGTKDKYNTDPIPQGKPKPVEPQEQTTADEKIYCTFSISCSTILNNMDSLDPNMTDIIPKDGWILKPERVEVADGESVFDILLRVCKDNNIHMEYSWTPIYNSSYIEGISNIYEFDCGDLSGWMYSVNSWYPNYGCSRYVVNNGDVIEWNYTCDSGRDLGQTTE